MENQFKIQYQTSQKKNGKYVNPWPDFKLRNNFYFLTGINYTFSTRRPSVPEDRMLHIGPKRYRPVPSTDESDIERSRHVDEIVHSLDVKRIDAVLISTNHYDHLDVASVRALHAAFPGIEWLVPAGVDDWLADIIDSKNVKGFQWWEEKNINGVPFTFVPSKYWSSRGKIGDRYKTLWGYWCIGGEGTTRFFFAGDSGYCNKLYEEIGQRFNGFDCAALPIGCYEPRGETWPQHMNPKEAVQVHQELRSKQSLGIRWGTFPLGNEPYMAPKETLICELKKRGMDPHCFVTLKHGETKLFGDIKLERPD